MRARDNPRFKKLNAVQIRVVSDALFDFEFEPDEEVVLKRIAVAIGQRIARYQPRFDMEQFLMNCGFFGED